MPIYKRTQLEVLGFLNAGGSPGQYDDFKYSIQENLNPRHSTEFIHQEGSIFYDPSEDNAGLGENEIEQFGLHDHHGTGFVEPHLTNKQTKHFMSLINATKNEHVYHDLVTEYTSNSYGLNSELFDAHKRGNKPNKLIFANPESDNPINIDHFDALINSHKLPHDVIVYSGIHWDPNESKGKIIILPAYTSSSLSPHIAKDFGEVFGYGDQPIRKIVKLHLPKGHEFLLADKGSLYPGQAEIILPRNMRIQLGAQPMHHITGKFENQFGFKGNNRIEIWHGRILPRQK